MSKRAALSIIVGGRDITSVLDPLLISLGVSLNSGGEADSVQIELDDTGGQIAMPAAEAPVSVSIGWVGQGIREVFRGTIDEVRSSGDRSGGRTLYLSAKSFNAAGPAKQSQRRHWDGATVKHILTDAGKTAGLSGVSVDPALATTVVPYFAMVDESLIHAGQRLAQIVGGHFRIAGDTAVMAGRGTEYSAFILASWGVNLHSWDVNPSVPRKKYGKVRAPYYDQKAAQWQSVERSTGLKSEAIYTLKPCASKEDATQQAKAAAATCKRDAGSGSIVIEGDAAAVPDSNVQIVGARTGIDGRYRIKSVTHNVNRSSGFVTSIELADPQGSGSATTTTQ
jgi:hypothetical protein